ncbi:hybrid sensor histidine kinase/response regulator [Desulfofustis glycolicus]|uniref:histidine kinase n=1 Tax=Desulfofustis glycolicus DSM 9705 TaxID=1121409 RepID=A0A1M5V6N9_9BACT|nr:PAS domain-containing protein [Desulfofustis glycolicus]MCB2214952.1 PAS domain-containing protein [Desulfobulbaceae bacterium]SHH70870.1 PAS domain S-box-containing protein [Desulfofustis glycolicus DSM 9705]
MATSPKGPRFKSAREKFLGLSLESTRKSYYPQLKEQLDSTRENEQRLQLLIDSLPAFISYIDADQRFILANRRYEKAFNLRRDEMVGRSLQTIVGETNYLRLVPYIEQVLAGGEAHFELRTVLPDNSEQWWECSYIPVTDRDGAIAGFYTLALDLTEKKKAEEERFRLEEKLREVDKFKAIGTLAGGIAHDFNNLLMGIQGLTSLMAVGMTPDDPHQEHVRAIEEHIRSAANLTRQLLGLARGGKYEAKPIDLNELVFDSALMFGRTRKEITIHQDLHPAPLVVEADRNQLDQVLLNIFVNAWQAMPDGGAIYLKTSVTELDESVCAAHDIEPGFCVKLSITDTGCGMDETTRQQVFDPFFTTKDKQRGTGLGLASVYGIIKNHGGLVTVYSEVGHGTTFTIYLPLSDKTVQAEPPLTEEVQQGSGTILLVDDEEMILDVGQAMLTALGYQAVIANGGERALDVLADRSYHFDLAIVDLIMPGLDGGKVFDGIRAIQPDLPVILCSGYSMNGQATAIMARGCNGFIQKPFNIKELSRILQQVLPGGQRQGPPAT